MVLYAWAGLGAAFGPPLLEETSVDELLDRIVALHGLET